MVAVLVLLVLLGLRLLAVAFLAMFIIRPVRECPACFQETLPIRVSALRLLGSWFEWRWCPQCRWQGPARKVDRTPAGKPGAALPDRRPSP